METKTRYLTREELEAAHSPAPPTYDELGALDRLLEIARSDTGQARRVADFLLAWWNAGSCGGFDMTNLWAVDTAIAKDMATVLALVARIHAYPDSEPLNRGEAFRAVVAAWRPELLTEEKDPS